MLKSLRTFKVLAVSAVALLGMACSSATAAPPAAATPPAAPGPAMWVIKDEDSTIYLFGTVHLMKPDRQWRTPRFEAAFNSAEEIWLEINDGDDPAAMQSLVMQLGMDAANPLSKRLNPEQYARFKAAADKSGLPAAALDPMKPWMAAITLSFVPMMKAGYDPNAGIDNTVKAGAQGASKPIRAFETVEQQLRFFDNLPNDLQVEFLMSSIDELDESASMLDAMVDYWVVGDTKGLEGELVSEMKDKYPHLYKVLLVDRNTAWADVLAKRLEGKGVSFVAVGSAHLVGDDSVQNYLAKKGIKASRY
ncbi:MAG: polysaccharide biosynthesis protein GumN [Caulobacter sp.]|nr:polysaccharide biosynthesis protein GumN [Caulobacter sp.]